jgi:hypothetical protein
LDVLSQTFVRHDYGIALAEGSPLQEAINRVLLEKIRDQAWQDILQQHLGNKRIVCEPFLAIANLHKTIHLEGGSLTWKNGF